MTALFARAWQLYRENPALIVPVLLLHLSGTLSAFARHGVQPHNQKSALVALLVLAAVAIGFFIAGCYLTAVSFGMSAAAWRLDVATYVDGMCAAASRWTALMKFWVVVAALAVPVVFVVNLFFVTAVPNADVRHAIVLHPGPGIRLALIAAGFLLSFFSIYAIPAIVVGSRGPIDGITRGIGLACDHLRETLMILVPFVVVGSLLGVAGGRLEGVLPYQPAWMSMPVAFVDAGVRSIWGGYITLVVVGQFLTLEQRRAPMDGGERGLFAETSPPRYE